MKQHEHLFQQAVFRMLADETSAKFGEHRSIKSWISEFQAEPLLQRALAISEQVLGPEHPNTALNLNNLAALYRSQGKYEQAEPLYERALAISEQVLGPEHPETATSLNNLAAFYDNQGDYEHAKPLYERTLAIMEKTLGSNHPNTKIVRENHVRLLC
ncbi:MAG: tetratricopeptide repeat protein [Ktedonobacteraceae bacterium]